MKPLLEFFFSKTMLELYPYVLILDRTKKEIYQDYAIIYFYDNGKIKMNFEHAGKVVFNTSHFKEDVFVQMNLKEKAICILLEGDDLLQTDFIFAMTATNENTPNEIVEKFFYYICHVFKTLRMRVHTDYDIFKKGFRNYSLKDMRSERKKENKSKNVKGKK